jgi:hypothetical protein
MPAGGLGRITTKESFSQPIRESSWTRAIFQPEITLSRNTQAFEHRRLKTLRFLGICRDGTLSGQQRRAPAAQAVDQTPYDGGFAASSGASLEAILDRQLRFAMSEILSAVSETNHEPLALPSIGDAESQQLRFGGCATISNKS